jgi:threonine 3-dehydrogenase
MPDTMTALVFDRSQDDWSKTKGLRKAEVPRPVLDEKRDPDDATNVIVKVRYTGFCGSDRGIWFRNSFKDLIFDSLDAEKKDVRVVGHEMLGEVVEVGSQVGKRFGFEPGRTVAAESHITCGHCRQCRMGNRHVCENERIIGFSRDGCFANYIKLPAHVLWPTDDQKIEPLVGAIQEPFGNAVHASTTVNLRDKTVAIFGCGPIGMFTILTARALGAARIVGIEPNEANAHMAEQLGVDEMVHFQPQDDWHSDPAVVDAVREFTDGHGVDVAFEMAGYNSSVNNAIRSVAQGGDVILFGIKGGDFTIENFSRMIVGGVSLHSVIGRRIWDTWEVTRKLLESHDNGIHDKIRDIILRGGDGTVISIDDYDVDDFENRMIQYPKLVIKW